MSGYDGTCLIKISDVLTLCQKSFKILSGALCCFMCCVVYHFKCLETIVPVIGDTTRNHLQHNPPASHVTALEQVRV